MNKNLSNADFLKILGPFVAMIAIGMGVLIVKTSRAPVGDEDDKGKSKSAADSKASRLANAPRWQREAEGKDYGVIEQRPVFGAVANETKSARQLPPPLGIKPMPVGPAPPTAVPPQGPAVDKIAVVGMVRINGETQAVVEDLSRGETKFVSVGGEAYGYRVLTIGHNEATLTKSGKQYVVAMGENKPEPRRFTPGLRGPGGAGPGGGAGTGVPQGTLLFTGPGGTGQADGVRNFFQNMSDEQRQQFRDQLRNMSPEERNAYFQNMRSQQTDQGGGGTQGQFGAPPQGQFGGQRQGQFGVPPPGN